MKIYYLDLTKIKNLAFTALLLLLVTIMLIVILCRPAMKPGWQQVPQAVGLVTTDRQVAALTFNINWGDRVAGPVLNTLKKQNVKATFFVTGTWASEQPELARRIIAEGHEIACYVSVLNGSGNGSGAALKAELEDSRNTIREASGASPILLRVAREGWDRVSLGTASKASFTPVHWSLDSEDSNTPGEDQIISNVLDEIHPGAIILMNASDTASQTTGALPAIIEGLKDQGYELVTVSSLLNLELAQTY